MLLFLLGASIAWAGDPRCPGADDPAPPLLPADIPQVASILKTIYDEAGRSVWQETPESLSALEELFSRRPTTKLEQFFQLLYLLQGEVPPANLPVVVRPPGIAELLNAARVFTDPAFPATISAVEILRPDPARPPLYRLQFSAPEVRFPINGGKGFSLWQQGMCQIARELVFYSGFSFRLRPARNSKNLVVEDFQGVQLFGGFGTRRIFSIDVSYVDLEKIEFIRGTDEGKVTARVARREFKENPHSILFRFIGTLIPNTSRQRIDW